MLCELEECISSVDTKVFLIQYLFAYLIRVKIWSEWDLWRKKWHWSGFLSVLQFPLPILIPPTAAHSLIVLSSTLHSLDTVSVVM
jgi:hypothetical protein